MVGAARQCVWYRVESPFPVREGEVELVELFVPPVVAGLHELKPERVKKWSVVSADINRFTQQVMPPLVRGMHERKLLPITCGVVALGPVKPLGLECDW